MKNLISCFSMTKIEIHKFLFILYFLNYGSCLVEKESNTDLLAFTVASHATDGYRDFIRSVQYYNISETVLGFGKAWEGGNMRSVGGGYKINLLKEALSVIKNERKVVLFTDSYDVLFLSDAKVIVNSFKEFNAEIVFSAEAYCWPDVSLKKNFSDVEGYRFLNSGGFIGYSDSIYKLLNIKKIEDTEDDQLYFSLLYVNSTIRNEFKLKLDHKANIFQNLFGAVDDVNLKVTDDGLYYLVNERYNTVPKILHGNGVSKHVEYRLFSNYLAGSWSQKYGCMSCLFDTLDWDNLLINQFPVVVIGIFIDRPSPFLDEFFHKIVSQNYPKKKIHLFIQNNASFHNEKIEHFISYYEGKYQTIKVLPHEDDIDIVTIRNLPMDYCVLKSCDVYLYLESNAHLDNPETLTRLIEQNRNIVAPLLVRPYKAWSNFWGALDKSGFYKRSFDYMDIVNNVKRGLWNVPYINSCYLIKADIIKSPELRPSYLYNNLDPDMSFCSDAREKGIYMYVDNQVDYGHLVDLDNFDPSRTNPEIYELFSNRWDWENRYLHPEYKDNFDPDYVPEQPCPDVYWFPIVSSRFCKEFVEIMEAFGKWSDGSHNDERLKGGYEAVPTRDIHMNQVGLDDQWLQFLKLYIAPLQELVFIGYVHPEPRSLMNFVVRYRPDEQPSLKPHHDSSTYTINVALNRPNIDYQGGGCRFIRYNCSITDMRLGWTLMHPGRLTHYHEGLLVTNGTRYIMISFVDP